MCRCVQCVPFTECFFYLADVLMLGCLICNQKVPHMEICLSWQMSLWLLCDLCPFYACPTITLVLGVQPCILPRYRKNWNSPSLFEWRGQIQYATIIENKFKDFYFQILDKEGVMSWEGSLLVPRSQEAWMKSEKGEERKRTCRSNKGMEHGSL